MKPHLLLDCYLDERGCAHHFAPLPDGAPSVIRRPAKEAMAGILESWRGGDWAGLIVTGSAASALDGAEHPWIAPLEQLIREALDREVPTLGVCFGHQIIAAALFGSGAVRRSPTPELGWFEIEVAGEPELLAGLGPRFTTFLSHFDDISPDLEGIEVLARSERCPVQAYRVPGRRVWCVQFHAEMDAEETHRLVHERSQHPLLGLDPDGVLAREVDSSALRERLLRNFLALAGGARTREAEGF